MESAAHTSGEGPTTALVGCNPIVLLGQAASGPRRPRQIQMAESEQWITTSARDGIEVFAYADDVTIVASASSTQQLESIL
eukprot:824908-Amphidinium_carterae.1